ncbi:hypothetical protein OROGR_017749 [Orobanche gracilis]
MSLQDPDDDDDEDYQEEEDGADGYGLLGNNGNIINPVTATTSSQFVNVAGLISENSDDRRVEAELERRSKGMDNDDCKGVLTEKLNLHSDGEFGELNRGEVDGLFCPICFEAWSSGGDHHICCLPCGHIYGLSCIKKWLRRRGSSKCPQCKKNCRVKDIRLLYATRIVAIDEKLQKTVRSLEAKCASLEKQGAEWSEKEAEWKKKEANFHKQLEQVQYLKERTQDLEALLENVERRASGSSASSWNSLGKSTLGNDANPNFHTQQYSNKLIMQKDFQIDGARLFDVDSSGESYIFARRLPGLGGLHVLTKVSLLSSYVKEDIRLPENKKAVKDLRVSPHARLVLLASLGKKLSILSLHHHVFVFYWCSSTESKNTVLTYNLPDTAWSCSWDICNSHYFYAGLQNGSVLQFDMRCTTRPVESMNGLTCNLIHTLHSISPDSSLASGTRSVVTASALGLCQWDFGVNQERPYLIPESDKQGVCISLAHCKYSDDIVASYRPKIEIPNCPYISQPTATTLAQGTQGSRLIYRKIGPTYQNLGTACDNVSAVRLPKSAIIDGVYRNRVFACGDDTTCELVLQELPSLMTLDRLKPRNNLILDVKYTQHSDSGLLSCLSEDSLQLYTAKIL